MKQFSTITISSLNWHFSHINRYLTIASSDFLTIKHNFLNIKARENKLKWKFYMHTRMKPFQWQNVKAFPFFLPFAWYIVVCEWECKREKKIRSSELCIIQKSTHIDVIFHYVKNTMRKNTTRGGIKRILHVQRTRTRCLKTSFFVIAMKILDWFLKNFTQNVHVMFKCAL